MYQDQSFQANNAGGYDFQFENRYALPIFTNQKKVNKLVSTSRFIFPFFWQSISRQQFQKSPTCMCEGVLSYQNGKPLNLWQFRFLAAVFEKQLPPFYKICRKTYQLRFSLVHQTYTEATQNLTVQTENQQLKDQKLQTLKKTITEKVEQQKDGLYNFLILIGLVSKRETSLNRYRQIYMKQKAIKKMREIVDSHLYSSFIENPTHEQPIFKSEISTIGDSQISESRKCCQKEFRNKKQQFQTNMDIEQDSQVITVQNIYLDGNSTEQDQGGYFQARTFPALVEYPSVSARSKSQIKIQRSEGQKKMGGNPQGYSFYPRQIPSGKYRNLSKEKLVVKLIKPQFRDNKDFLHKVQHEKSIIRQIKKNKYLCKYYQVKQQVKMINQAIDQIQPSQEVNKINKYQKGIIMQGLSITLKDIIGHGIFSNHFLMIKQLTKAVLTIHDSGIVHRDLKPGNVMFDSNGCLKIIDFSQSIQCWTQFNSNSIQQKKIGFTLPYSPLQCSKQDKNGYSKLKIDNWSLGMTACELILESLPVCYSKSLKASIKSGWGSQEFHFCMNLRSSNLNNSLLFALKVLCLKLMNFQYKKRLCLQSFHSLLQFYETQLFQLS